MTDVILRAKPIWLKRVSNVMPTLSPQLTMQKAFVGYDEGKGWRVAETGCENGEDGAEEGCGSFERDFGESVLEKECFDAIGVVIVFAVENCFFVWVYSYVLEHAYEVEWCEFLYEAKSGLYAVVIAP